MLLSFLENKSFPLRNKKKSNLVWALYIHDKLIGYWIQRLLGCSIDLIFNLPFEEEIFVQNRKSKNQRCVYLKGVVKMKADSKDWRCLIDTYGDVRFWENKVHSFTWFIAVIFWYSYRRRVRTTKAASRLQLCLQKIEIWNEFYYFRFDMEPKTYAMLSISSILDFMRRAYHCILCLWNSKWIICAIFCL